MASQETKILYYKILHRNEQKNYKNKKRKIVNLQSNINFIFVVYDFNR